MSEHHHHHHEQQYNDQQYNDQQYQRDNYDGGRQEVISTIFIPYLGYLKVF